MAGSSPPERSPDFRPGYHQLHRVGRPGIWRSILGVIVLLLLVFVVVPLIGAILVFSWLMIGGRTAEEAGQVLSFDTELTPTALALLNVMLAMGIPLAWLVSWLFHRLKPGWLSSVGARMRWRYFAACLGLSVIALAASLAVALVLPTMPGEAPVGEVNDFTTTTRNFLLVVLFLTPLQAAGEEYVFRGYLTQAFGSVSVHPRVAQVLAVLGPALLFALAHGSQSLPVFIDRLAFGIVAGVLVLRTGGLEAAVAMHVLNNFLAFAFALTFGDMTAALNASGPASYWMILSTLTQSLVYLALAAWAAKAMGMQRRGPAVGSPASPPVLAPSPPRV